MPTKTPSKAKGKAGAKESKDSKEKDAAAAKKKGKAEPVRASQTDGDGDGDGDEDDDDDEDFAKPAAKPAAKGAAAKPKTDAEPAAIVPARRLTPEAKAKVNEMVSKGMSLTEALKVAASWETFVAPVREEPVHAMPGFGDGRPRRPRGDHDNHSGPNEEGGRRPGEDDDIEPTGGIDTDD